MKRKITRVLAALFAMVMLVSCMSFSAFADNETTTASPNGHTYELYQIFTGSVAAGTETLSTPKYGYNAVLPEGKSIGDAVPQSTIDAITALGAKYGSGSQADMASLAEELAKYVNFNESGKTATYTPYNQSAEMPLQLGTETRGVDLIQPVANDAADASTTTVQFKNLPAGYYMVKDTTDSTGAQTLYIIKVTGGTMLIEPKGSEPTAEKQIVSEAGSIDVDGGSTTNAVAMGDTVNFAIKGTVSSYVESYRTYYYCFTDTLSKGFKLDEDSVHIYVNDKNHEVTKYFYKNATTDSDGVTILTLAIEDLLELENVDKANFTGNTSIDIKAGTEIFVCYSATLTKDALVSSNLTLGTGVCDNPNSNSAKVTFSNNPNISGEGKSTDTPDVNPSTSPTPPSNTDTSIEDTTYTYTTGIKILKTDTQNKPLTGAVFTLTAADAQIVGTTDGNAAFELTSTIPDGETAYYKLKVSDDITSYTTIAPSTVSEAEQAKYEKAADGVTYATYIKKASTTSYQNATTDNKFSVSATVDESGYVTFTGLGPGKYILSETTAPVGYAQMNDQEFTIAYNATGFSVKTGTNSSEEITVPFKINELDRVQWQQTDGMFHWQIQDNAQQSLPHTGGIGTTIFYVVGSALVVGAAVLLITKKRMSNEVG
jgi:fimbrial isopeptide formation D2 family protein/LPXTG-motif cell wall-anchored protein